MVRSILVVEDDPLNMKLARTLLQLEGYEVLEACTGEEALGVVRQRIPDLILMDVRLPDIDGLEVCKRLKNAARTSSIPVVVLSSYAMADDQKNALDAGCDGYITKPIDAQSFARTIARFFTAE